MRKAMLGPQSLFSLFERGSFALLELLHALADCSYGFCSLQAVEECLIAFGVLKTSSARPLTVRTRGVFFALSRPT